MLTALWVFIAYLSGSMPLSLWLGMLVLHTDIRTYGDGNPGASNVFRVGGKFWGTLAMLLDGFKGAIPVWIAIYALGIEGWWLTGTALAPILGHAFSPFLKFKGGKALAVSFGIWAGLTLYQVPMVMGITFGIGLLIFTIEGWAVMLGMAAVLLFLFISGAETTLMGVWLGTTLILAWTHRVDLQKQPTLRFLQ